MPGAALSAKEYNLQYEVNNPAEASGMAGATLTNDIQTHIPAVTRSKRPTLSREQWEEHKELV
jgi:hypothetical protein